MARAKPSTAALTVSVDTVSFNKQLRKQIVTKILDSIPRYTIRRHEIYNLLKARYRQKGINKKPNQNDVLRFNSVLDRVVKSLPGRLVISGKDESYWIEVKRDNKKVREQIWLYDDQYDSALSQLFFRKLEAAVEGYIADKELDSTRPTQKEVREYFNRLDNDCERLEKRLRKIDDASRAFAASHGVDVDEHIEYLDQLRQVYDYSKTLKISKKSHARYNLCVAVGRALNSIGVAATTSRSGLMDELIGLMVENITGESVEDIQDTLRAALPKIINNSE